MSAFNDSATAKIEELELFNQQNINKIKQEKEKNKLLQSDYENLIDQKEKAEFTIENYNKNYVLFKDKVKSLIDIIKETYTYNDNYLFSLIDDLNKKANDFFCYDKDILNAQKKQLTNSNNYMENYNLTKVLKDNNCELANKSNIVIKDDIDNNLYFNYTYNSMSKQNSPLNRSLDNDLDNYYNSYRKNIVV